MYSIRQNCQLALRSTNNGCIYATGSRRAFSRTSACSRGALPVYLESSKPELATLLATLNSKILLPRHLTKEQQKLVYKQDQKAKLEAEPIEITLGDVTLPLEHIDRNHLPTRQKTIADILKLSEEGASREDWENVVRMLEGFENAGIRLDTAKQAMVIRKLFQNGQEHLVLKALQRPKATGLRMRDWRPLFQILRGVFDQPALADWEQVETENALRLAKQIVELLEDEEHCGAYPIGEEVSKHDFRGRPGVIAVPTALAAALALRHEGDVEEVKKLAGRLVVAMKQHDPYNAFIDDAAVKFAATESDFNKTWLHVRHATSAINTLQEIIWVSSALRTSLKVLGDNIPHAEEARQFESKATKTVDEGCEMVKRLKTRNGKVVLGSMADHALTMADKARALA
ncbi:hypothetical protein HBI56_205360 [Parastagonospora nodorum]|uniref:Uncharacterized protein n=1 Tax=Phaeosphaeria nodorum (strain SN15 / ATCC MYA-4574 / FGSC 10173) TaxID=321614 RepID=A0A7U2FGV7_PHANO|nr:hypothetical protein HBH56_115370 [Parastagonospora nodorum]QRD05033.1 hypothetical protein JI435_109550 [Parastagonospora nodorum SN15]KAH3929054.1 hypothetical protein HBH54_133780 [Parastagonospora nodorum]KAH3950823.1 hypothetical protein HBH53_074080 [Parastagonospora nodorum]KAH3965822.1 hypothetical protein HBH51_147690 [Parastagonospora nodorum]